jgi:hypothetical protein
VLDEVSAAILGGVAAENTTAQGRQTRRSNQPWKYHQTFCGALILKKPDAVCRPLQPIVVPI